MESISIAPTSAIMVLRDHSPDEVAKKMILEGQQKEPFYIFNMDDVYQRVQHFKKLMPRVKIFYAMKSNDTDMMVRVSAALDMGFDCATVGEIHKIRTLNVPPSRIIFAIPTKTPEQMVYARASGVTYTTVDNFYELEKLSQYWPDAHLLLRIRVDSVCLYNLGTKFGCDYDTEAIGLLEEAANLGLKVVGVAFHVGDVCLSSESFIVGIRQAKELFDHEARAGRRMTILDIGGGFCGDRIDTIDEVGKLVSDTIEELFPEPDIEIIAEPGRYLCETPFTLFCSIFNTERVKKDDEYINMLYLSDGTYGTIRFSEKWHNLSKLQLYQPNEEIKEVESILWGPSGDSFDQVMKDFKVKLPQCSASDWLVFANHGAYTIVFSSYFSSIPIPLVRSVVSWDLWQQIKDHEVFKSMEYLVDPDVSRPLLSSLPPVLPTNDCPILLQTATLNV